MATRHDYIADYFGMQEDPDDAVRRASARAEAADRAAQASEIQSDMEFATAAFMFAVAALTDNARALAVGLDALEAGVQDSANADLQRKDAAAARFDADIAHGIGDRLRDSDAGRRASDIRDAREWVERVA